MTTEQVELWMPRGHVEKLVVGARVRVRVSGECESVISELHNLCGVRSPRRGHRQALNGNLGVITAIDWPHASHNIVVNLINGPIVRPLCGCDIPSRVTKAMFAATELEVLE